MAKIMNVDKNRIKRKISTSQKVQVLDIFIAKFCQILKEQKLLVLVNLFQNMTIYAKAPSLFYEARMMTVTKFSMFFLKR